MSKSPSPFVVSLAGLAACALPNLASAQNYTVTDLDPSATMVAPVAVRLADGADPVGYGQSGAFTPSQPVVFRPSGPQFLAQKPGDFNSTTSATNRDGIVVGWGFVVVGSTSAVEPRVWWNGNVFDLNAFVTTPTPLVLQQAAGIDDRNRVVGNARLGPVGSLQRAFVLENGVVTDLHALAPAGTLATSAEHVSVAGPIVGWAQLSPSVLHACMWDASGFHDLNDPSQGASGFSYAVDVDRSGRACGVAKVGADWRAAVFDHGTVTDLGTLYSGSAAAGMNDLGVIVGNSDIDFTGFLHAVIWRDGVMTDLNALISAGSPWELTSAMDVDNEGRIVAYGQKLGVGQPCLLVPNCAGGYTVSAAGCPAAGAPKLAGVACPIPGTKIALVHENGPPNAAGILLLGTGGGAVPINGSCSLSIGPIVPFAAPIALDADGASFLVANVPPGTSGASAWIQSVFPSASAPGGVAATHALRVSIP